jgi:catechol 2,3-dioxygenase-like lactoylglutathione lyase family enzyme
MEDGMNETTTTRITDVRTIGVPVTDQDRAVDFYVGKLGFEKRMDVPFGPAQRWVEVAPPGAATTIALVAAREGATAGVDTGIRFATEDAAADHADLRSRGVDADAEILNMGGAPPMFTFRDQDGNRLVVVQSRP